MTNLKEVHQKQYEEILSMIDLCGMLNRSFLVAFTKTGKLLTLDESVVSLWISKISKMVEAFGLPEWNKEYPYGYLDEGREPTTEESLQHLAYRIDAIRWCINNSSLDQLTHELSAFYMNMRSYIGEGDEVSDLIKIKALLER